MADLKTLSNRNWTTQGTDNEAIQTSCLMRIADATEKMSAKYVQMEADLEWYKKAYRERVNTITKLYRSISTYKGHIKRLKSKIPSHEQTDK